MHTDDAVTRDTPMPSRANALIVLILAALVLGFAPILVRLTDAGPAASGFWRFAFSLPWLLMVTARAGGEGIGRPSSWMVLAGGMVVLDFSFWHYSIALSSVANATTLTNLTPVVVTLVSWWLFDEKPKALFIIALAMAIAGALIMSLGANGQHGINPPLGDLFAGFSAFWYSGYFIAVKEARGVHSAGRVMLWSTVIATLGLLLVALVLGEDMLPGSLGGWASCVGLGVVHLVGQGGVAWSLGRLPTTLTAVIVLIQPITTTVLGWLIFAETLSQMQAIGGGMILAAIILADWSSTKPQGRNRSEGSKWLIVVKRTTKRLGGRGICCGYFTFMSLCIHNKASRTLDEYYRGDTNLHHGHALLGIEPPSFLEEAIDACEAAKHEYGEYPSMYEKIVDERILKWKKDRDDNKYNFIQMINSKLGGYMFATKLGVRTPRVLFCGMARDISKNMKSFGNKYVIKPLLGHSTRGVKVVKDGFDMIAEERVSYKTLTEMYNEDKAETMVEELMESANPKFDGLIPPDYKFFVYEGGISEIMWYIDRNKGKSKPRCGDTFDARSDKWILMRNISNPAWPLCSQEAIEDPSRRKALKDAVQILASNSGPNWIRIDMFDTKHYGPVLGEFTPFSTKGHGGPLESCVMSYLFIAHAEHGAPNDDSDLLQILMKDVTKFKDMLRMKNKIIIKRLNSTFAFYPPQAREWLQYDEMTKCKKVMKAQQEYDYPQN